MQLNKQITKMLKNMDSMINSVNSHEFIELSAELSDMRKRLTEPLRVAVVGVMKAGKSTLMNAILKEKILFTGTLEATYTVSWFKYGEKAKLCIVFKDGKEVEAPYSDLEKWTVRPKGKEKTELDSVKHVIIYYPNEILKTMELIDTPGLESSYKTDAQHTLDFIGQKLEKEAGRLTSEAASQAEAIVYAFSRGVQGKDAEVLDAFKGEGVTNSSPINAIGIFTKADVYWDAARAPQINPLHVIEPAVDGYKAKLKDKLYNILPVVAKPVETVTDLDDRTFDILQRLASLDIGILMEFLADATMFITEPVDKDMSVSCQDREHVLTLYGQYGIYTVTMAIKSGVTRDHLAKQLYEISGVERASNLILQHFGNRAYLIKLDYVLRRIRATSHKVKRNNSSNMQISRICERIIEDIDQLREDEQAFKELEILQSYYNEEFKFTNGDDEKQFLEITGEYGSSCESRLGFNGVTSIKELKKESLMRSKRWNSLMHDFGVPQSVNKAAEVIVRSCDSMYYHLDMLSSYDEK